MELTRNRLLTLVFAALVACGEKVDDGKRFIGNWESVGDPLQRVEIVPNGSNFVVTGFKGVPDAGPDLAPLISTTGTYPAVLKNGLLEFSHALGATTIDVVKDRGELIFAGSRYKRSANPRPCSVEDSKCISLFDLYRMNPQFRERFHSVLMEARISTPDWVPFGGTIPISRKMLNQEAYVFGLLNEPHNAFHVFYIGYNETRQQVFGVYVNQSGDRVPFGVKGEADPCTQLGKDVCVH